MPWWARGGKGQGCIRVPPSPVLIEGKDAFTDSLQVSQPSQQINLSWKGENSPRPCSFRNTTADIRKWLFTATRPQNTSNIHQPYFSNSGDSFISVWWLPRQMTTSRNNTHVSSHSFPWVRSLGRAWLSVAVCTQFHRQKSMWWQGCGPFWKLGAWAHSDRGQNSFRAAAGLGPPFPPRLWARDHSPLLKTTWLVASFRVSSGGSSPSQLPFWVPSPSTPSLSL